MAHIVSPTLRRFRLSRLRFAVTLCLTFPAALASPKRSQAWAARPFAPVASNKESKTKAETPPTIRWNEQRPGCTFSRGTDGKYHYGIWDGDVGVVMAVDARELQLMRHRVEPIVAIQLTIRYRGADSLDAGPEGATLQFMKHFQLTQPALDADSYVQKVQADADAFDNETRRAVAKHPAEKQARETQLQEYQRFVNEWIEFLSTNSLRDTHLDRANPEVRGWVFFDTQSKWLGGWKPQEEFILRLPLAGKLFEFPFKLPPEKGEFLLQKRQ